MKTVDVSGVIKWRDLNRDTRPIEVQYEEVDKEYKDEARDILISILGYVPSKEASMVAEINFRDSLKRLKNGSLSKEKYDRHKISYAATIQNLNSN